MLSPAGKDLLLFFSNFNFLCQGISQHVSSIVKLNWLLILAAILFGIVLFYSISKFLKYCFLFKLVCCSCINSKSIDVDQLSEHQTNDNYYPSILFAGDSNFVERAAPRLGRASPRLGRASPRLGRRTGPLSASRFNHAGRYYNSDDDATNDYQYDIEPSAQEKRAAPRLGRAI
jgi:hypothetical protein